MKQAKIFPVFIAVIVIVIAGYIGFNKMNLSGIAGDSGKSRDILTYVPDDTLFFVGGLKPTPFKDAVAMMAPQANWLKYADWSDKLNDDARKNIPPAGIMILSLITKDFETLQLPDAAAKYGVGDSVDAIFYSVGFIPVMRIKLSDTNAFNKYIDDVEQFAKLKADQQAVAGVNFRSYSFDLPDSEKPNNVKLLIGVNNGYAIVTLNTNVESADAQGIIAGSVKPKKSLAASNRLTDIQTKHNFLPIYLGYINHQEIMDGITGTNSNEFGRMLDSITNIASATKPVGNSQSGDTQTTTPETPTAANDKNPLEALRTDACRKELMALVDTWPQTVFGYTKLEFNSKPRIMESRLLIENTDAKFMQDMQAIRGFIPAVLHDVKQKPVFGFGLGINVDSVSPFIAKAIQGFTAKDYQCESLNKIKQSLMESNPSMALGMMSGMAAGLQGISATIMDIDGSLPTQPGMPPDIKKLDAMLTISSSNPQQLLMMAANFQPGMPPIQLPADGSPIDLPIPLPLPNGAGVKLALKGNHIVAYTGEKATKLVNLLSNQPLQPNGLFVFNIDFGQYMKLVANMAQVQTAALPAGDQIPKPELTDKEKTMLEEMSKLKLQMVESFDIDKDGMAFDIKVMMD